MKATNVFVVLVCSLLALSAACDQQSDANTGDLSSSKAKVTAPKEKPAEPKPTNAKANMSKPKAEAKKIAAKRAAPAPKKSDKAVIQLTNLNFAEKVYQQRGVVVVDFYTDWCKPCKYLAPILEKLAKEYDGEVVFGKIECDRNPETKRRHGVRAYPTIILFKDGEAKDAMMGVQPADVIKAKIDKLRG